MIALVLLALLPLDVSPPDASPAGAPVRMEVALDGRLVRARLTNGAPRRLLVFTGYSCSGPEPFSAVVDGEVRPFASDPVGCAKNVPVERWLGPGEQLVISSQTVILDDQPHRVAVRYEVPAATERGRWSGAVTSPVVSVGRSTLELSLAIGPRIRGEKTPVVITHIWRGAGPAVFLIETVGACPMPQDVLIVNGVVRSLGPEAACAGPAAYRTARVEPGQPFATGGSILLAPGRHTIRARYEVVEASQRPYVSPPEGPVWTGRIETAEVTTP
jgi:hypothetical protein